MGLEQYKDRAIITIHSDGPRGPKGDKGDRGEKGDPGEVTQEEFDQQKDAINLKIAKKYKPFTAKSIFTSSTKS